MKNTKNEIEKNNGAKRLTKEIYIKNIITTIIIITNKFKDNAFIKLNPKNITFI